MDNQFKYDIGDEPSRGFVVTDRTFSPITYQPVYFINDYDTPFYEDEVEHMWRN